MRATVIAGEKGKDDYVAIWNGIRIGHVLKVAAGTRNGRGASPSRINPSLPPAHRGQAGDLDECKRRFKVVWPTSRRHARIRKPSRIGLGISIQADRRLKSVRHAGTERAPRVNEQQATVG
jgi:hypothetical protein